MIDYPHFPHHNFHLLPPFSFNSDSDRTDCVSDLGQEAGDECDTDDLLDREYGARANGIGQAAPDDDKKKTKSSKKQQLHEQRKTKKKVLSKKRNKNSESSCKSPMLSNRGCRSVGGTPVLIRRSAGNSDRRNPHDSSLTNRSNSLTFSEVHLIHSRMLGISDSEKALIKADLEADMKYRQLIHEAESILISMKSNLAPPSPVPPKEPPQPIVPPSNNSINSPRRVCQVPTNKRVEMLRNCEVDLKRELSKASTPCAAVKSPASNELPPSNAHSVINKRLEMLRYETSMSAPSSPKNNRVAPIKTHITNFIYQNEIELSPRRSSNAAVDVVSPKKSPKRSPSQLRRRFFSPRQDADSDSDSDQKSTHSRASGKENGVSVLRHVSTTSNVITIRTEPQFKCQQPPPMISFRSVICNNLTTEETFLPQSEPLKRKIYSRNNKTIDKIQRSLEFDEG